MSCGEPCAEEVAVLRLLSEQNAVPLDQLARFFDVYLSDMVRAAEEFRRRGWVEVERLIGGEYPWVWLRNAGDQLAGTGFSTERPRVWSLAHWRAISEVRIFLERQAPEGRWISERELRRERRRDRQGYLPDAVFEIDGRRHAVEAELTVKGYERLRPIVASHVARYDLVVYFCSSVVRSDMERSGILKEFPDLVIRGIAAEDRSLDRDAWRAPGDPRHRWLRYCDPEPWEVRVLQLVAEQGAVPLDQLGRFLDCREAQTERVVERLLENALVRRARPFPGEPDWIWPTKRGAQFSGTGLSAGSPRLGGLLRRRAVNDVRLYLMAREPDARWVSRRELLHGCHGGRSVPDAVLEWDGERHAIELILSPRDRSELVAKAEKRSAEFDLVIWFYGTRGAAVVRKLVGTGMWSKVIARPLPGPGGRQGRRATARKTKRQGAKRPRKGGKRPSVPFVEPRRFEMSDDVWAEVRPLIPVVEERKRQHARRSPSDRAVLSGWLWLLRHDRPAGDLPRDLGYGSGSTVAIRLREWKRLGVFESVRDALRALLPDGGELEWLRPLSRPQGGRPIAVLDPPERFEFDDEVWDEVSTLIPSPASRFRGGPPIVSDRAALSGIVWILRNGGTFSCLDPELGFGAGAVARRRLRELEDLGVWEGVQRVLQARLPDGGELDWGCLLPQDSPKRRAPDGSARRPGFNLRQSGFLSHALQNPDGRFSVREYAKRQKTSVDMARIDLDQLVERGLLELMDTRGRRYWFKRGPDFVERLKVIEAEGES